MSYKWEFLKCAYPPEPKSIAFNIWKTAVDRENSGKWLSYVDHGSMRVADSVSIVAPVLECTIKKLPYGTPSSTAYREILAEMERVEGELRSKARLLKKFGGGYFVVGQRAIQAPRNIDCTYAKLQLIINAKPDYIWVHGAEFVRTKSGTYLLNGELKE